MSDDTLSFRNGSGKNTSIPTRTIEQLYTTHSTKLDHYALVVRADGQEHVIIDNLAAGADAYPIEQAIEEFLQIDDDSSLDAEFSDANWQRQAIRTSDDIDIQVETHIDDPSRKRLTSRMRWSAKGFANSIAANAAFTFISIPHFVVGKITGDASPLHLILACAVPIVAALTYPAIASLFNRSQISTDDKMIRMQHGPLPWFATKQLELDSIVELRLRKHVGVKPGDLYRVVAVTRDGKDKALAVRLTRHQAIALRSALAELIKERRPVKVRVAETDEDANELLEVETKEAERPSSTPTSPSTSRNEG